MSVKQVITYLGQTALSSECRYIMGKYYLKYKECFLINDTWYRIDSPNLFKDYETGSYITKNMISENKKFVKGIVGLDEKENPIIGFFTHKKKKNVRLHYVQDESVVYCISEDICKKLNFNLVNGIYFNSQDKSLSLGVIKYSAASIKKDLPYRASEVLFEFLEEYNKEPIKVIPRYNIPLFRDIKYTFGIEIETDSGIIPQHICYQLGLMPLRDGSIRGIEYATIPLYGAEGIESIYKIYETIKQFTTITTNNSVHLHLGGYPRTKENITALYTLLYQIQDEVYFLFPSGYRNTATFKMRDYCSPLPTIKAGRGSYQNKLDSRFESIWEWMSGGIPFVNFSLEEHPADAQGEHKWQINQRYKWVNLISLLFGSRGTVEFRIHNPTIDPTKVVNWLLICTAILKYAEDNCEEIINSTLNSSKSIFDIIKHSYNSEITGYLIGYLSWKSNMHLKEKEEHDDQGFCMLRDEYAGVFVRTLFNY